METSCTFRVVDFTPVEHAPEIQVGVDVGHAHMVKEYDGAIAGRSATQFSFAYDDATNTGTYVATESFQGTVDGRAGTFAFVHSATTRGGAREHEFFVIVPGSGTGELAGITGTGELHIDEDGTHRIVLDYDVTEPAH